MQTVITFFILFSYCPNVYEVKIKKVFFIRDVFLTKIFSLKSPCCFSGTPAFGVHPPVLCDNAFPHSLPLYGLSPMYFFICPIWSLVCENAFPHLLHWHGIFQVCILICPIWSLLCENAFPHSLHLYNLSSMCFFLIAYMITTGWECLSTFSALTWPLPSVYFHMPYMITTVWEYLSRFTGFI